MKRFVSVLVVLLLVTFLPQAASGLDDFYLQNGDAYLLIGNGPKNGVYRLNNLTQGAAPVSLYVPGEAFNLSASMKPGTVPTQPSVKELWTFASGGTTGMHLATKPLERRVTVTVYIDPNVGGAPTSTALRDQIVHVHHNYPGNTGSGVGIHDTRSYPVPWSVPYGFSGDDYPCTWMPSAVPGKSGYYYVNSGRWYHSGDPADKIWSSFPYLRPDWFGTTRPNNNNNYYNMYGFVQCMDGAGFPAHGGWCHKLVRETVQVNERILNLFEYNVTQYLAGLNPAVINKGEAGRVVISSTNTKDTLNECGDPCAPGTGPGSPVPYGEQPYMDCLVSGAGRSYLYSREPGSSQYMLKMNALNYTGSTIGSPGDLTAKKLGVSSKTTSSDWVYVLGINEVNKWLTDANVPVSGHLLELTDVAVSDQWWQTGGIVYAYDRQRGFVYKFVRNETTGVAPVPEIFNVFDGEFYPDSIDADGFGNLYFVKTERFPANAAGKTTPDFTARQAVSYYKKSPMVANLYAARFEQTVAKAVSMRDYYKKTISPVKGSIAIGTNTFEMDFTCDPDKLTDRTKWTMIPPIRRTSADVAANYRTEVAVINVSTPPKVAGVDTKIDLLGPLVGNTESTLTPAVTPYNDATQYFFKIENAPLFDENGVNTEGEATADPNGNNFVGVFPSTTKQSTLKFYWKVTQTKNLQGDLLNNVILDGTTPSDRTILPAMFGPGEYEIAVRAQMQYYQYDRMPVGVLSDRKEDYLSGVIHSASPDGTGWARVTITVTGNPPPPPASGACVIMTGKPSSGGYTYHPTLGGTPLTSEWTLEPIQQQPPAVMPTPRYVIPQITGSQDWAFCLRENLYNKKLNSDRISIIMSDTPPEPPADGNPFNVRWLTTQPKFTWKISLPDPQNPSEKLVEITRETSTPQLVAAPGTRLFEIPSEPGVYTMRVDATRVYAYDYYRKEMIFLPTGGVTYVPKLDTKYVSVQVMANCEVIVLDDTPPALELANLSGTKAKAWSFSPGLLWGTTGEILSTSVDGKTNASEISLWVADDNPYGNVTTHANITTPPVKDPYFSQYQVKHKGGNRVASFSYQNAYGELVPSGLEETARPALTAAMPRYRSAPDGLNTYAVDQYAVKQYDYSFATLPSESGLANVRSWSYRKYTIPVSALVHYSKGADGVNYYANMDYHYANNISTYTNLLFGFSAADASSNAFGPVLTGELVIRDNDRPNLFLRAIDEKDTSVSLYGPSNVNPTAFAGPWRNLAAGTGVAEDRAGNETWSCGGSIESPAAISGFMPDVRLVSAGDVRGILVQGVPNGTSTLEIDVPVVFSTIMSDNAGQTTRQSWSLRGSDGTMIADMGSGNVYRHIFREDGWYTVEVTAVDDAKDWPSDPRYPTAASSKANVRSLKISVPVASSRLDTRIIEKNVR